MAETYKLFFRQCDVVPMEDGVAAVFNNETTDLRRYFEVTEVVTRSPSGFGGLGGSSGVQTMGAQWEIDRISAYTGGTAFANKIKRDTASADLPSQVTCVSFPDSVTTGDRLRRLVDAPTMTFAGGNNGWGTRMYGGSLKPYVTYSFASLYNFVGNDPVQRIVLREGEGLAFVLTSFGFPRAGQMNIVIRNASSGATYQFRSRDIGQAPAIGRASVALMNGSGSGITLEVDGIDFPLDGETNQTPGIRLVRIDGTYDESSNVTPVAMDGVSTPPAALVAKGGSLGTMLGGSKQGVQFDWNYTHGVSGLTVSAQQQINVFRRQSCIRPFGYQGNTPSPGLQRGWVETVLYSARAGDGIVLRPGQGLGVNAGRIGTFETSTHLFLNVEMTVLHYPPPSGGSGGGIRLAGHGGLAA